MYVPIISHPPQLKSGDNIRPHQHRQQHCIQLHLLPPHCRHSVLYPNLLHVKRPSDHRHLLLPPPHQCTVHVQLGCHATFRPCRDPDWLKLDHYCRSLTLLSATNAQDVRKHYLKLSVQLHPDKSNYSRAMDRLKARKLESI